MAPHRPRTHQIADKSIIKLHDVFVSAGWTVEDLDKDYGEDLLVRIFKNGEATPYTFYVQAKSTDNISRYLRKSDSFIHYPFDAHHLAHWDDFWEPVILTIWDSQADLTYWETIQMPERRPDTTHKRPVALIPRSNILDDEGLRRISSRTINRHERFAMEQQGAQLLVERLQEVLGVEITYDAQIGLLLVAKADGGMEVTCFGKMAERLEKMARNSGISPQEVTERSIDLLGQVTDAFNRGGELVLIDKAGAIRQQWATPEELMRYIDRAAELDGDK